MAVIGSPQDTDSDVDRVLAGLGVSAEGGTPSQPSAEAPTADAPDGDDPQTVVQEVTRERIFISPIARKLLREAGLSAEEVTGSGPRGRIRRRDVEAAIAERTRRATPSAPAAAAVRGQAGVADSPGTQAWTEIPHSRLRRAVATRLGQSKREAPHFYLRRSVDLDALLALRATVNELTAMRVSINDLLIRAIAIAYTTVPEANVIWTEDAMHQFAGVDIAVAIASDKGLVTPVLRSVEQTSITEIADQVRRFVDNANAGRLQQHDLQGGSITISNLGMYGVDEFSAIINPPHSAILAVGAAQPTVVARDGQAVVATCANLVLSVDHRAIDGALAARWMAALVDAIEQPIRLLI